MDSKRLKLKKHIVILITFISLIFLAIGLVLGVWSGRDMREQVSDQFNEEQLIIARNTADLIERELDFIKKEILLLSQEKAFKIFSPKVIHHSIQKSFQRVLKSGVWKIEIVDPEDQKVFIYRPHGNWSETDSTGQSVFPAVEGSDQKTVWVSKPQIKHSSIDIKMAMTPGNDSACLLIFHVNISWFLSPFLKNIRSGKTGYAWIVSDDGIFLYHPDVQFVGKSAFKARQEKYPNVPYGKVNFIQKEMMLKGQEGTGWYFSGWHRGITGQIKKLIAYCPIAISDNPPQKWSVAVVAPVSEVEEAVERGNRRQFVLQGMVVIVIILGSGAILFLEMRWSRILKKKVDERTEELKRSEEKYRSLVESAEDLIFTVDGEGKFQSMNSFTANFFGGRPEDFLGKDLFSLFPREVSEKQLELIRLVYEHGKSVRDEFEINTGDYRIWINANFMPLKDKEKIVNAVLCIARDITENKNLEHQLITTEKLASLGTLAAGVAHEINNPLGVILGFCELLLQKADNGTQEFEDLKTIERQGIHCKEIVENLLSFARFEKGNSEYADLNLCLGESIKVAKHTLEMNDIELLTELDQNIPSVRGDPRQLQQVFLNLISNGIAAMGGGGTLLIRTKLQRSNRKAVIQFQDNGMGIRKENMEHIFEPFFTTKPEGEGTGLGLFVSYGIISKYGGTIECISHDCDSSSGSSGTSFIIKLPIAHQST